MTDEEISAARTKRMMIVQFNYNERAMSQADAFALLAIFTRATRVEKIHTSNYSKTLYVASDDQEPPFDAATVGNVQQVVKLDDPDPFAAATRAVS